MSIVKVDHIEAGKGETSFGYIPIERMADDSLIQIPLIIFNGSEHGPRLGIIAGVHGDEFEGIQAILRIADELNPKNLSGTLIFIPILNPPAYAAGTRDSPLDGLNLARVCPGKPNGSITMRIAYKFYEFVIPQIDHLIDLHSAGKKYSNVDYIAYRNYSNEKLRGRSKELADAFGTEIVVIQQKPVPTRGNLDAATEELGIPYIWSEMRGEGKCCSEDVQVDVRGVMNILKNFNMIEGEPQLPKIRKYVGSEPDSSIKSKKSGFLTFQVKLGEDVNKGQKIATINGTFGKTLETIYSPYNGMVTTKRVFPTINPGEGVITICRHLSEQEV